MYLELDSEERRVLCELIEARLNELPTELRRSMNHQFHDELKCELEVLRRLGWRLKESAYDVCG